MRPLVAALLMAALAVARNTPAQAQAATAGAAAWPTKTITLVVPSAGGSAPDVIQWYALFAPARTPRPVVNQLNQALNTALADPELVQGLEDHGAEVQRSTPEQLARLVQDELAKWQGVVHAARLTAE